MGKSQITSNVGEGLYNVDLDFGTAVRDARVADLTANIAETTVKIAAKQAEYDAAVPAVELALQTVNIAINAYVAATQDGGTPDDWTDELAAHEVAIKVYFTAKADLWLIKSTLDQLKLEKVQRQKEKNAAESAVVTDSRHAWCVTYFTSASGQVATIEIDGESDQVLIAPGGRSWVAGDGYLQAREMMTPEQAYFNAAILPGWQKWMPTYRTGVITALDFENDTADVLLDAATSSAQDLNVNLQADLPAAPVEYMACNAGAFSVGDAVVVQFNEQLWSGPRKVIGFVNNPCPCPPNEIRVGLDAEKVIVTNTYSSSDFQVANNFPDDIGDYYVANACGVTVIWSGPFIGNGRVCRTSDMIVSLSAPASNDIPLANGMVIVSSNVGEVARYFNSYDGQPINDTSAPTDAPPTTFWGLSLEDSSEMHYVDLTGDDFGIKKQTYATKELEGLSQMSFSGHCPSEVYEPTTVMSFRRVNKEDVDPMMSPGAYLLSKGAMPTITVTFGERTFNYEYDRSDNSTTVIFKRAA